MRRLVACCFFMSLLPIAGCTVGPDHAVPETPVAHQWRHADDAQLTSIRAQTAEWWDVFHDPTLDELIQQAVDQNLDLQQAIFRVAQARYQRGVVDANLFPQFDTDTGYTFTRNSQNGQFGGGGIFANLFPGGGGRGPSTQFEQWTLGLNLAWEVDMFGRLRRNVEAADADIQASEEDYRNAQVMMVADVATNYVDARTFQDRLRIARDNLKVQLHTLDISDKRFKNGLASELDVVQAQANVKSTEATIPDLEVGYQQAVNRLSGLLGRLPGEVDDRLSDATPIPQPQREIAIGIPAELLGRRPDIRAAERQLAAQAARIGVAEADLYPVLSINGSFGATSAKLDSLFTHDSIDGNIGPAFRWNILNFGRIRCNVLAQESVWAQNALAYQSVVLRAAEETDNALMSYSRAKKRRRVLEAAVVAAKRAVELSEKQYQRGTVSFQRVLDSERELLRFQDQLASSEASVATSLIQLFRALGGGWESPNDTGLESTFDAPPIPDSGALAE